MIILFSFFFKYSFSNKVIDNYISIKKITNRFPNLDGGTILFLIKKSKDKKEYYKHIERNVNIYKTFLLKIEKILLISIICLLLKIVFMFIKKRKTKNQKKTILLFNLISFILTFLSNRRIFTILEDLNYDNIVLLLNKEKNMYCLFLIFYISVLSGFLFFLNKKSQIKIEILQSNCVVIGCLLFLFTKNLKYISTLEKKNFVERKFLIPQIENNYIVTSFNYI